MKFKIGDKVDYIGNFKQFLGRSGVITKKCPTLPTLCKIVRMSDGSEQHMFIRYLKLNQKNQQLLFSFMGTTDGT